jgi:hypothetical protein
LMSNHVHLVAVPEEPQSLAMTLRRTHGVTLCTSIPAVIAWDTIGRVGSIPARLMKRICGRPFVMGNAIPFGLRL